MLEYIYLKLVLKLHFFNLQIDFSALMLFLGRTKTVTISYPTHWEDMKGKKILIADVKTGSSEWQSVEQHFRKTFSKRILVIKRVQNVHFWEPYAL